MNLCIIYPAVFQTCMKCSISETHLREVLVEVLEGIACISIQQHSQANMKDPEYVESMED